MRQALTVLLVLLFGLGPLTAVLPGSDEARLPACCRREGAHHCAMAMPGARDTATTPSFSAHRRCPMYPGASAALLSTAYAMLAEPAAQPDAAARLGLIPSPLTAMLASRGRTLADRGPPTNLSL